MLVLSRKKGESIKIGHDITITIVEVRGDRTRIGIEAPKEVPVDRSEIRDARNATIQSGNHDTRKPTIVDVAA